MDRETETLLSLFIDGQLSERERRAFERRLENEPELREAVDRYRRTAAEWKAVPDLPEGFAARARARLDGAHPQAPAGRFWGRFWTLETAGLLAAAGIIAAVLIPFLRPDETGQVMPRKPAAEFPAAPAPVTAQEEQEAGRQAPMLMERSIVPPPSSDERMQFQEAVPEGADRSDGEVLPLDKGKGSKASAAQDSDEFSENLPVVGHEYYDVVTTQPGIKVEEGSTAILSANESRKAPPEGEKKVASEPLPGPAAVAPPERVGPAARAADPAGSFAGDQEAAMEKAAGTEIPFRLARIPGPVDLGKRGFVVMKNQDDLAFLGREELARESVRGEPIQLQKIDPAKDKSSLGIDLDKEMGVLIPARRPGEPPVRIEVAGVHRDGTRIRIRYREIPIPPDDPARRLLPDYQLVILPASELPIELQKVD